MLPRLLFCSTAVSSLIVFAQEDMAGVAGIVTDATGAVVPAAQVTAADLVTGESRVVVTSDNGAHTGPCA